MGVEHSIKVKEDCGPIVNLRRVSKEMKLELWKEVKNMEEMGIVQQSNSPWATPVVCARSNGLFRLALESGLQSIKWSITAGYIALNPMKDGLIDRLSEARYFAILDAKFGYHHMPINEEEELSAIR